MNLRHPFFLFCALIVFQLSACSQQTNESKMREVTSILLTNLKKCDTTKVLELYQVSFSHIDKENYRTFVKENILNVCEWYNKITEKYGSPNMQQLVFKNDSLNGANIVVLPLLEKSDTALNLKNATLYVIFYPDQFFNDKILSFTLLKEAIKTNNTIIAPPPF